MAKKKEADKAEKAERERARQEALMAKAVKRARDTEAKKASAKGSTPADAATNGEEPPAKRCAFNHSFVAVLTDLIARPPDLLLLLS